MTVAARTCLLEGPAFDADGNLYFSDIIGNRIYRMTPDGDALGLPRRQRPDQRQHVRRPRAADQLRGGRVRAGRPAADRPHRPETGTDRGPDRSLRGETLQQPQRRRRRHPGPHLVHRPVLRRGPLAPGDDRRGGLPHRPRRHGRRVLSQPQIERPNGLAITPDDRDALRHRQPHPAGRQSQGLGVRRRRPTAALGGQRLVFDFGRGRGGDGMRLDERGNLWVAAGILLPRHAGETADVPAGVYVITPDGELLGRIPIPEDVCTNLTFGGPDRKTLYVTSGKTIFKVPMAVAGYALFPVAREISAGLTQFAALKPVLVSTRSLAVLLLLIRLSFPHSHDRKDSYAMTYSPT